MKVIYNNLLIHLVYIIDSEDSEFDNEDVCHGGDGLHQVGASQITKSSANQVANLPGL